MASLNEQREIFGRRLAMVRSQALDAYSGIEQALCWVMARLANMDIHPASVIYFRIGAHPRNVILDELMKHEHCDAFQPFWDSMMGRVRGLYQRSLRLTDSGPFPGGDGLDVLGLIDQFVPSCAGGVDDVVVGLEDAV